MVFQEFEILDWYNFEQEVKLSVQYSRIDAGCQV